MVLARAGDRGRGHTAVIVEVSAHLTRAYAGRLASVLTAPVLAGTGSGVAFMYLTAMLVKI